MKWEVRGRNIYGDSAVLCWGTDEKAFPDAKTQKILRVDGHKIYVDGKLYKETENKKK